MKAFRRLEHMMDDRLERLFCDEYRRSLQRRYDLTDEELSDLLDTLQKMLLPGLYLDPRLKADGLVPYLVNKAGDDGLLVRAAEACRDGYPMPAFDLGDEDRRRAAAARECYERHLAANASHEARPARQRATADDGYARHAYPSPAG